MAMQSVTESVTEIMSHEGMYSIAYIDDIAGIDSDASKASTAFDRCGAILRELGLVEAENKQTPPCTKMTWLGVEFDSDAMQTRIPRSKIHEVFTIVGQWVGKTTCRPTQLRSLLGKLFFTTTCSSCL